EFHSSPIPFKGQTILFAVIHDITERNRITEVQHFLAQTSSVNTEEPFFNVLARYLAISLEMDFVCIDILEGDGLTAKTLAVWCDGHFEDNVIYALKDTPCGEVVGKRVCCFPANVCNFFPKDQVLQELSAESYIGVTLFNHSGKPIGLIAVIRRKPLLNSTIAQKILQFVAIRAASELERMNAENILREREEQFRTLATLAPVGIYYTDADANCLYTNPAWCKMAGLTSDEAFGNGWLKSLHKDDRELVVSNWGKMTKSRGEWGMEYRFQTREGIITHVYGLAAPQYDESGKILRYVGVNLDITDRKLTEEELLKAKQAAEEATQAKSTFLANMSHEIRTPMNAIINMNKLLLNTSLNEEQKEYAKIAMSSSEILLFLINDILDFSKIEAGKLELENINFSLTDIITSIITIVKIKAKEKKLLLEYVIDDDVYPYLIGDPGRVRQILLNFLNNAIKFTEQGSVTLHVSIENNVENRADNHSKIDTHTTIKFSIKDTGIGISEKHKERLFKSFSQEEASISRKYGGTGLGLAISKQLAELMGGEVGVKSTKGVGSIFWFTVKFEKNIKLFGTEIITNNVCEASESTLHKPNLSNAKILLAEDNIMNQKVALAMLRKSSITIDIANNGKEAVEAARKNHYDLILMDMQMPELDGIEATKIIRSCHNNNLNSKIPIVAMTANATIGDRQQCFDAGMNDYISKPVDSDELLLILSKYISSGKTDEDNEVKIIESATSIAPSTIVTTSSPLFYSDSSPPIFDRNAFLNRLGGNEEALKKLIVNLPQYFASNMENLKTAINDKDAIEIRFYAHTIKGIALNASAKRVVSIAQQIEFAGKEKRVDDACIMLEELANQIMIFNSTLCNMYPEVFNS
ncbi:MAG: response regulator, partial [Desulfamplus sp.]|nr:response regulator [Desulfamplus sp.]